MVRSRSQLVDAWDRGWPKRVAQPGWPGGGGGPTQPWPAVRRSHSAWSWRAASPGRRTGHSSDGAVYRSAMRSSLFALAAAVVAPLLMPPSSARAQDVIPRATEPVCLGFAFGAFTPKLDWAKAGHAPIRDGSTQQAPDGRDWASDQALPNDSSLFLFPSWWPVGVWVELATRAPAPGDTVTGRATALVARGNVTAPVATVRAWRVPCGRSTPPPAASSPPDSTAHRARPHS